MRTSVLFAGIILLSTASPCLVAQFKDAPDRARLLGTEWQISPIEGSYSAHCSVVEGLGGPFWLSAGRIVFLGRVPGDPKPALFGLVDGRVSVLARHAQEFPVSGGHVGKVRLDRAGFIVKSRKTVWVQTQGPLHLGSLLAGGRELYASTNADRGYGVLATDGAAWHRIVWPGDSLRIRGVDVRVREAVVVGVLSGSAVIAVRGDGGVEGLVRATPDGLMPLVLVGDSIPGGDSVEMASRISLFARWSSFRASGEEWSLVVGERPAGGRTRLQLITSVLGGGLRTIMREGDPFPGEPGLTVTTIQGQPLGGGRHLAWVYSVAGVLRSNFRGGLMEWRGSAWTPVLTSRDWRAGQKGWISFMEATAVSPSTSLASFRQGTNVGGDTVVGFPDVYLVSATGSRPLPWDSLLGHTAEQLRSDVPGNVSPISLRPAAIDGGSGTIVTLPLGPVAESEGSPLPCKSFYFDHESSLLGPVPSLRVKGGRSIAVSEIIGWNSPTEAVVLYDGRLAYLRPASGGP